MQSLVAQGTATAASEPLLAFGKGCGMRAYNQWLASWTAGPPVNLMYQN